MSKSKAIPKPSKPDLIEQAIKHFSDNRHLFEGFGKALMTYFQSDKTLSPHIHFIKFRLKDPESLRAKLNKKAREGVKVNSANLFDIITDLAGIRVIHLHTAQLGPIHKAILAIFEEQRLQLVEQVTGNCWDIEYESIFKELGIAVRSRESMYTTVHYVVQANQKTRVTCEVQVRTLMDEVWGEVSHKINYPEVSKNINCQNQLKVLARLTSGCTRLVDSIFTSHESP